MRELTVFRELEIPDYREWLLWELSSAALDRKHLADIQINIETELIRLVVEDHLFGTSMEFDLELAKAASGIWQFENHAGDSRVEPIDDQPILESKQFATCLGFPADDPIARNHFPIGDPARLAEVKNECLRILEGAERPVIESMLVNFHGLAVGGAGRPTNAMIGRFSLNEAESVEAINCTYDTRPQVTPCDNSWQGILYIQLEDVFYASFNHFFLCRNHSNGCWEATINLLENQHNCSLRR